MTQDRYFLWDSRQDHLHGDVRRLLVDNGYLTDTAPSVHVVLTNEGRDFGEFGYWIGDGFHLNGIAIMTEDGEDGPYMNWSSMDKLFGRKVDGPI